MSKQQSWTRQCYEHDYRHLRRGVEYELLAENRDGVPETLKAADYSYQAHEYWVSGWSSDLRRERFYAIKRRILTQMEDIPF